LFTFLFLCSPLWAATTFQETEGVNKLVIRADQGKLTINPEIYGHFAEHLGRCIYDGIWVGENSDIPNINGYRKDIVDALKALNIPVLRWPGGCFADEYHWKDGIGPRDQRPKMVNTHWGMVTEDNSFGTHEFLNLCELLGTEAYVAGNVGSGTVQEMQDWVEYMTSDSDSTMANVAEKWPGQTLEVNISASARKLGLRRHYDCGIFADQYKASDYVRNFSVTASSRLPGTGIPNITGWMYCFGRAGGQMTPLACTTCFTGNWGNKAMR
jgi:alpha-N-arabinofuranosidase